MGWPLDILSQKSSVPEKSNHMKLGRPSPSSKDHPSQACHLSITSNDMTHAPAIPL